MMPSTKLNAWLKSPIVTWEGIVKENGKNITHSDFINNIHDDIIKIINKHNYRITNSKLFKSELITIIYSLSHDGQQRLFPPL